MERAFEKCLGHGIKGEMRRKRLELARELLCSTDETIAHIAATSGIGAAEQLHRAFRAEYGMTPQQFRAKVRDAEPKSAHATGRPCRSRAK